MTDREQQRFREYLTKLPAEEQLLAAEDYQWQCKVERALKKGERLLRTPRNLRESAGYAVFATACRGGCYETALHVLVHRWLTVTVEDVPQEFRAWAWGKYKASWKDVAPYLLGEGWDVPMVTDPPPAKHRKIVGEVFHQAPAVVPQPKNFAPLKEMERPPAARKEPVIEQRRPAWDKNHHRRDHGGRRH